MNLISREEYLPLTPHAYYVLLALARHNQSGYDLYETCSQDVGGAFSLNRRNLYRTLHNLEKYRLVKPIGYYASYGSPYNRTVFAITPGGKTVLAWEAERYIEAGRLAQIRLSHLAKPVTTVTLAL